MFDPVVIGIISAATALVASVLGPIVTFQIGRAQIRAAVLSANRQKWIDGFRELIAGFCSQLAAVVQIREKIVKDGRVNLAAEPEILHQFERLVFTINKIKLMINPLEDDHRKLLEIIESLLSTLRTTPPSVDVQAMAETTARQIVEISQGILRREWLRVQRGA
jgi:hypothetical protein